MYGRANNCRTTFLRGCFSVSLITVCFFCPGCSHTEMGSTVEEKEALEVLKRDYDCNDFEMDDKGRIIKVVLKRFHDDAIMDHICKFKMLKAINLGWSNVTDEGIKKLQGLKRLESLNIVWTPITDRGLAYLEEMTSLRFVTLSPSKQLTSIGIASLQNAIPGIRVFTAEKSRRKE
jgi:hypothetical protein